MNRLRMRHDGKRDLPEPYKTLVWTFGRLEAVTRGATEAAKKFGAVINNEESNEETNQNY